MGKIITTSGKKSRAKAVPDYRVGQTVKLGKARGQIVGTTRSGIPKVRIRQNHPRKWTPEQILIMDAARSRINELHRKLERVNWDVSRALTQEEHAELHGLYDVINSVKPPGTVRMTNLIGVDLERLKRKLTEPTKDANVPKIIRERQHRDALIRRAIASVQGDWRTTGKSPKRALRELAAKGIRGVSLPSRGRGTRRRGKKAFSYRYW